MFFGKRHVTLMKNFDGRLERLKKCYSQFGARIFELWRGFSEEAGLKNPVTEPKRSQSSKRPPSLFTQPNGYDIFENALEEFSLHIPTRGKNDVDGKER